jgi:hypothetical protein
MLYLQSLAAHGTKEYIEYCRITRCVHRQRIAVFSVYDFGRSFVKHFSDAVAFIIAEYAPVPPLCLFSEGGKGNIRTTHMQIALPYVSFKKFLKIGNGVFNLVHGVPPLFHILAESIYTSNGYRQ